MFLRELKIKNFKGLQDKHVSFTRGANVVIGAKNTGKTTFLESISVILLFDSTPSAKELEKFRMTPEDYNKVDMSLSIQLEDNNALIYKLKDGERTSKEIKTEGETPFTGIPPKEKLMYIKEEVTNFDDEINKAIAYGIKSVDVDQVLQDLKTTASKVKAPFTFGNVEFNIKETDTNTYYETLIDGKAIDDYEFAYKKAFIAQVVLAVVNDLVLIVDEIEDKFSEDDVRVVIQDIEEISKQFICTTYKLDTAEIDINLIILDNESFPKLEEILGAVEKRLWVSLEGPSDVKKMPYIKGVIFTQLHGASHAKDMLKKNASIRERLRVIMDNDSAGWDSKAAILKADLLEEKFVHLYDEGVLEDYFYPLWKEAILKDPDKFIAHKTEDPRIRYINLTKSGKKVTKHFVWEAEAQRKMDIPTSKIYYDCLEKFRTEIREFLKKR